MSQSLHPYPAEPTKVIRVSGNDRDIGRQHAEQVGDSVSKGMTRFYYDFWQRILGTQPPTQIERAAFKMVKTVLDVALVNRLRNRLPDGAKARIRAMAEVSASSYDEMLIALILPDLLPMIQAYAARIRPAIFVEVSPPPRMGCSSIVTRGENFFHARNLDFPGVAYWDRYPVLQVTTPKEGLKYLGFTSAGVPFCGISGVNEAQISVALHQHYCLQSTVNGDLPFVISEEILRTAESLDEAREILERNRVATSWAFIVTDGKKREAFIYETHPKAFGIRYLDAKDPFISHSNYFQTRECQPSEYATTDRMNWDNYWRKTRLDDIVAEAGPSLTAAQAVKAISDHYDSYWGEEKYVNRIVSQVYNIQSYVLDVENMKVWFAEGDAPIHSRHFTEYDIGKLFSGVDSPTGNTLEGYRFGTPEKQLAKDAYIKSFIAAFDGRHEEAIVGVNEALGYDFCAEAALVGAVLNLKTHNYRTSLDLLQKAKEWVESRKEGKGLKIFPPEYFELSVWLARTLDLMGKRQEALEVYRYVATHQDLHDVNIRNLAKSEGPYRTRKLTRILMPYSTYIPFE